MMLMLLAIRSVAWTDGSSSPVRAAALTVALGVAMLAGCAAEQPRSTASEEGQQPTAPAQGLLRPAQHASPSGGSMFARRSSQSAGNGAAAVSSSMFVDSIRVRLVEWCGGNELQLGIPGPVRAFAGEAARALDLPLSPGSHTVRAGRDGSSIHLGRYQVRTNLLRLKLDNAGAQTLFTLAKTPGEEPTPVRGSLTLRVTRGGQLEPILTLDMESYVAGSLLAEMPASFGKPALRAQAVTIRTFTSYRVLTNRAGNERPYDVQSSVADLRYGGTPYERPVSWQVARETAGELLTYRGELFPTFFHSTSGGTTISARDYFGSFADFPPLAGGIPSPSDASPLHQWQTTLEWSEVREKLVQEGLESDKLGPHLRKVQRLFPASLERVPSSTEADPQRRPHSFALVTDRGTVRIQATRLRAILGSGRDTMPSTCCVIEVHNNRLHLRGHGFGHGVGLCQYGAAALGEAGKSYQQILARYYPQSELVRLRQPS